MKHSNFPTFPNWFEKIIFYSITKIQCLNCIQCFLACFEKTLKFITRNAYIEMSISGKAFIPSAKKSFKFMVNNAISVATVNAVTFILLWFSKFVIAIAVSTGAFYWQQNTKTEDDFNYTFSAAVISGLLALIVSHIFMEVYDVIIFTIFVTTLSKHPF